jgi:hypothetical protein
VKKILLKKSSIKGEIYCFVDTTGMREAIGFQNPVILIDITMDVLRLDDIMRRTISQELRDEDDA